MIHQPTLAGRRIGGDLARGENGGTFRKRRRDPSPVETAGVRWVCARARPGREFAVADDLAAVGFRAFCPHGVKVSMRARVPGGEKRVRSERDFPVFGAYVFVGEPHGVFLSRHSHWHLLDVLENAGGSRYVPTRFVEAASEAWNRGKWDGRIKAEDRYKAGETVRISAGPFQGWNAIVESLPSELQAIVRVTMLGAERPVKIDVEALEVV